MAILVIGLLAGFAIGWLFGWLSGRRSEREYSYRLKRQMHAAVPDFPFSDTGYLLQELKKRPYLTND